MLLMLLKAKYHALWCSPKQMFIQKKGHIKLLRHDALPMPHWQYQ